jgi:hypothetical protein
VAQGMYYSFFVVAKISVPVTIRKFNYLRKKEQTALFKDPVHTAQ